MLYLVKSKTEEIISLLENTGYYLIDQQIKHEYKTYTKEDGSILTELDLASEFLIKNELMSIFGNVKVLSEENSESENMEIAKEKFCFLLDPIDGTKNFDKGKDFTINLAFCVDKKPVVSFIHNPRQKTILFGDDQQSFKKVGGKVIKLNKVLTFNKENPATGIKQPLRIAIGTHKITDKQFVSKLVSQVQQYNYNFSIYNLKAYSAMGKLLSFIENKVDAFFTTSLCKDWDVLPALPILQSIGADYHTYNDTLYKDSNFDSGVFIVARGKQLLSDLVEISKNI